MLISLTVKLSLISLYSLISEIILNKVFCSVISCCFSFLGDLNLSSNFPNFLRIISILFFIITRMKLYSHLIMNRILVKRIKMKTTNEKFWYLLISLSINSTPPTSIVIYKIVNIEKYSMYYGGISAISIDFVHFLINIRISKIWNLGFNK